MTSPGSEALRPPPPRSRYPNPGSEPPRASPQHGRIYSVPVPGSEALRPPRLVPPASETLSWLAVESRRASSRLYFAFFFSFRAPGRGRESARMAKTASRRPTSIRPTPTVCQVQYSSQISWLSSLCSPSPCPLADPEGRLLRFARSPSGCRVPSCRKAREGGVACVVLFPTQEAFAQSSRSFTTALWPEELAKWRAVPPRLSIRTTSAPCCSSATTTAMVP